MKNFQKGFVVPLLLTIIGLLIIAGGIYLYIQNKQSPAVVSNKVATTSAQVETTNSNPSTQTTTQTIVPVTTNINPNTLNYVPNTAGLFYTDGTHLYFMSYNLTGWDTQ